MDTVSITELIGFLRMNEAMQWDTFQIWFTVTVATIVVSFVGRNELSSTLRKIITGLYLLATITIFSFVLYLAAHNRQIELELLSRGVELPRPLVAAIAQILLVLAGVSTTIYFIHKSSVDEEH